MQFHPLGNVKLHKLSTQPCLYILTSQYSVYHNCCQFAHTANSSLINHCPQFSLHNFVVLLCLAFDRTSELPPFLRKQLNQLNKVFLILHSGCTLSEAIKAQP